MKNSILFQFVILVIFLCLATISVAAQGSGVGANGYTSIDYDDATNTVTAYSETDIDYELSGNYQTYVQLIVTKSTGGVAASGSAQDNSGFAEVVLNFTGEANTTYTATGWHNAFVTLYDYYDYYPYQEFYHDEYYLSYFQGQGIYEPWFHFFESPGYRQYTIQTNFIKLGKTYDSVSSNADSQCSIASPLNLTLTARQFIGKCCQGRVNAEFPGELYENTVRDIRDNKNKSDSYKTAWKLISRQEYRK